MSARFHRHRLLLDENMPPKQRFPNLNRRYDVKHIRDDFHQAGLIDEKVYAFALKQKRLIVTFNGADFAPLVGKSAQTGVIALSAHLLYDQIDTKLTALLVRSGPKELFGKFTDLTGETTI